jgi:phospholipase C
LSGIRADVRAALLGVLLLLVCGCQGLRSSGVAASGTAPSSDAQLRSGLNHIIFMLQENRSFDSYFGRLGAYRAAAGVGGSIDGLPANASNPSFDGASNVPAFKMQSACSGDLSSSWNESHFAVNRNNPSDLAHPLMNGFVWAAGHFARDTGLADVNGIRAMGYYDETALPFYYFMATQFATSDRFFSPVLARTQPNRIADFAATTAGHVYPPTATLNVKTIFDLLDQAKIDYRIYETNPGSSTMNDFTGFRAKHTPNFAPIGDYFKDLGQGTLPPVAFIETGEDSGQDEHPDNNVQVGAAFTASLINALMQSTSWKDSVFLLSWDEGGGLYDHVSPQPAVPPDGLAPSDLAPTDVPGTFNTTGFRVPLIVVSPFARKGYVSHTTMDATAILKLIEDRFGLPSLTRRDAAQPSMLEFFDFSSAPSMTPPTPPAQPINMPCYSDHLP